MKHSRSTKPTQTRKTRPALNPDAPIPYVLAAPAVDPDAPIPYRLAESAPHVVAAE